MDTGASSYYFDSNKITRPHGLTSRHQASFFLSKSLTCAGLALPLLAFMA